MCDAAEGGAPTIRLARADDAAWLAIHDRHVSADWTARCIGLGEYLIAESADGPAGVLRFSWFWSAIPYMDMIHVVPERRRQGIGSALVRDWEARMRQARASILMTSSMSDEPEPQAWHRRNGFVPSGSLTFGRLEPTPEMFFINDL